VADDKAAWRGTDDNLPQRIDAAISAGSSAFREKWGENRLKG